MKNWLRGVGVALWLALSIGMMGCAGDRYHQSTGEAIDSTAITTKVKAALLNDAIVKGLSVKVTTFRGEVQLSGFVDTPEQKKRAEELAWGVEGVKAVKNSITIKEHASTQQTR